MSLILTGSPAGFGSSTKDYRQQKQKSDVSKKSTSSFFCCSSDNTTKASDIDFKRKD
jgi:hypothetical protein